MKNLFLNFFRSLPKSTRWFLVGYFLLFPISLAGRYLHAFNLPYAMALSPDLVWKGQVWRLVSYAFLQSCPINWLIGTFWLATLVSLLKNDWTPRRMLGYSLLGALGGAIPVMFAWQGALLGNYAVMFALLVAWVSFHGRESVLLLGIGELTVRQAAILVAAIISIVLFFGAGLFLVVAMWCGGVAGWLWLALRSESSAGQKLPGGALRAHHAAGTMICAEPQPECGKRINCGRAFAARLRAKTARDALRDCRFCAHDCRVNRRDGESGLCHAAAEARVFSAQVEVSDELELIPTSAIALCGCDLRCDFCITGAASWNPAPGNRWTPSDWPRGPPPRSPKARGRS